MTTPDPHASPESCLSLASRIDYALLAPALSGSELEQGCRFGRKAHVASVCVRPSDLRRAAEFLSGSRTAVSTVIGFPHGSQTRAAKVYETREAIEDGYSVLTSRSLPLELDMMINLGRVVSGAWSEVRDELRSLREITRNRNCLLKVIFETGYLTSDQIRRLCELCSEMECDFVKTSTGFGPRGASVEDVMLMREASAPQVRIKASGGIRSLDQAFQLISAGADRLGIGNSTAAILEEYEQRFGG